MDGKDKGLILLAGRPMLAHVLERIAPQVECVVINANRNQPRYRMFGRRVIGDLDNSYRGPLSGVVSVMRTVKSSYFVCVPCDAPLLPALLVDRLHRALGNSDATCSVAHNGESIQPVFALFRHGAEPALTRFIESGESKVRLWHDQNSSVMVDFSDTPGAFVNINTPEQLRAVERQLPNKSNNSTPP